MFSSFRQLLPELQIEILSRVLESERDDIYYIVNESSRFKEANYNKNDLWYLIHLYDNDFATYAKSSDGMRKYAKSVRLKYTHYGKVYTYMTRIFGKLHSFNDKPALIEYNDKCEVLTETWCYDGHWHRVDDKPARINYTDVILSWRYMDTRHRNDEDKYSVIQIDTTGKRILWDKFNNGRRVISGFCYMNDPSEYAKELFNYISKDKIDDYIKRHVG